jgi:hypothetical protein
VCWLPLAHLGSKLCWLPVGHPRVIQACMEAAEGSQSQRAA